MDTSNFSEMILSRISLEYSTDMYQIIPNKDPLTYSTNMTSELAWIVDTTGAISHTQKKILKNRRVCVSSFVRTSLT